MLQVPKDWLQGLGEPPMGLGAGAGVFSIPTCQQMYMSWTMANAGDTPANYLPSPIWSVFVTTDTNDPSGLTFNINGYYTGSWSGNPGTSAAANIDLETTDKFTINSMNVIGTPVVTGACAPAPTPPPPTTCAAGQVKDSVSGVCVAPCPNGSAPASGVCHTTTATTPATAPSGTGAYVAVGAAVLGVGALAWYFLK